MLPICCPPSGHTLLPYATPLARLTWLTLNTDPLYASVSSCLAGDSPDNTTQAPGPEPPLTPTGAGATSGQGALPASQGVSPRLNLTGAVRVLCEIEKVALVIQRRFLQQEGIPESSLYLGQPSCNISDRNSTHVTLAAAWNECGTALQSVRLGRRLRASGSRSGEGQHLAWETGKILHPGVSDSECRTEPGVRTGWSYHGGTGAKSVFIKSCR